MTRQGTNIQPRLLAELLAQSEPSLFGNKSELAVSPVEKPVDAGLLMPSVYSVLPRMIRIAEWHADFQVRAWRELLG